MCSVDLTVLSPPGLDRVTRKVRFEEDLEVGRGVSFGFGEARSARVWEDLLARWVPRVRDREDERENDRIEGDWGCDRGAMYEVEADVVSFRASRSSVEGRGNCGVRGARERCCRLGWDRRECLL